MNRRLFLFPSLFRDSRPTSRSAGMKTHSRVIRSLRYRNRIQPVCFQQRAILFCMRTRFCSFRNGSGQYLLTVHMQYPLPAVFIRRPVPDDQTRRVLSLYGISLTTLLQTQLPRYLCRIAADHVISRTLAD